ncbi:MAG TPA: hypothetical protein VJC09_02130 [Candidatus Saccharimonadales bacterium]|nr:hypothetical protein [Candidatus Saccharimonadales bacterium]
MTKHMRNELIVMGVVALIAGLAMSYYSFMFAGSYSPKYAAPNPPDPKCFSINLMAVNIAPREVAYTSGFPYQISGTYTVDIGCNGSYLYMPEAKTIRSSWQFYANAGTFAAVIFALSAIALTPKPKSKQRAIK